MVDTHFVEMNKFIVVDQNEYQNEYPACGTCTRRPRRHCPRPAHAPAGLARHVPPLAVGVSLSTCVCVHVCGMCVCSVLCVLRTHMCECIDTFSRPSSFRAVLLLLLRNLSSSCSLTLTALLLRGMNLSGDISITSTSEEHSGPG